MNNIFHIACNTMREAVRDKIFYLILAFALILVGASRAIGWISVGEMERVVKDFSLAIISLFGALIAVFMGASLIYKEIEKRTIYTILSKPVRRWEFIFGKFAGLAAILSTVVTALGGLTALFVKFAIGGSIDLIFCQAVALCLAELLLVTAMAVLFSTVASPILSAVFTFCSYMVGQVTPSLMEVVNFEPVKESMAAKTGESLTDLMSATHWFMAPLSKLLYLILPNLTYFSRARNAAANGEPLTWGEFGLSLEYAACYVTATLVLAALAFQRKKF